jgi:integrase
MAAPARRYVVYDDVVPALAIRVTENGHKSFVLAARFPGSQHHTRRHLGNVEGSRAISLSEARRKARAALAKIGEGIDPKEELRRQNAAREAEKKAALRAERTTFSKVVDDFAETVLRHQRRGEAVERQLRREFLPRWADRQIDSITPLEVSDVVRAVAKRGAIHEAHNLLGAIRRLYTWAISCGAYGLEHSPCDRLRPKDVIGVGKSIRRRVLTDDEIRTLWQVTAGPEMGYAFAPIYRLLLVTGQRKSEVAEAVWTEFDLEKRIWTIPAERMKADASHVVPLSDMALTILASLPRFNEGTYLFSTTFGRKPVSGFSKAKARLDALMSKKLGKLDPFVVHDLRRTVRTRLSAAPVEDRVRELVIGHTQRGLHKVYDQHAYLGEKRQALDWWATQLRGIIAPIPDNVVAFQARA